MGAGDLSAEERAHLFTVAEQMAGIGHWRLNVASGELIWSDEVYRIHGVDPAHFTPTLESALAAYHPDDRATVEADVTAAIESAQDFDFVLRIVRPDGTVRRVEARGRCEAGADGQAESLIGVFHDVTESGEIRELVARTDRMAALGTMAAGVAHEINNPLTWVMGSLELLDESVRQLPEGLRDDMRILVRDARQGAERVAEIVQGLRIFSRPPDTTSEVELSQAIEDAIQIHHNQIRHRAVLERSIDSVPPVRARATDLVQVLASLLANAVEAIPVGSASEHTIRVALHRGDDNTAVVEVHDNGIGMKEEVARRAFEPFFTTKAPGQGTGLGLGICHNVITGIGGTIMIESTEGHGTHVRIEIPTVPPPSTEPVAPPLEGSAGTTGSVMVIDDEQAIRSLAARALRSLDVLAFANGGEALAFLEEGIAPDVILCDLMMPDLTGRDVYEVIDSRWPELSERVVFLTGGVFVQEMSEWIDGLDNLIVEKPFGIRELRELVSDRVAQHA